MTEHLAARAHGSLPVGFHQKQGKSSRRNARQRSAKQLKAIKSKASWASRSPGRWAFPPRTAYRSASQSTSAHRNAAQGKARHRSAFKSKASFVLRGEWRWAFHQEQGSAGHSKAWQSKSPRRTALHGTAAHSKARHLKATRPGFWVPRNPSQVAYPSTIPAPSWPGSY